MIPLACNQSSHYVEKIGEKFVLNVILSNAERYLMDIVGQNAFEVRFLSNLGGIISTHSGIKSTHESAEMIPPTQNSGITVIPQIIYNKDKEDSRDSEAIPIEGGENKKADDENENDDEAFFPDGTMMENIFSFLSFSSFFFSVKAKRSLGKNIEEIFNVLPAIEENNSAEQETDKDKTSSSFKSSWKEVRDLSLDCYSQIDFHFIIENTEFNDSPEDKIIQEVWSDLNNHPEQEEDILDEDYASSNIIPVTEFNRILFNVWSELKEQDENFQLSEQDVRNIFGFDAVWKDDEWQYVISSSKIRKLRHEEEELPSRRNRKVRRSNRHGWEERMKIQEYLDCLYEIGKKNFQRLTKAEKAIYEIDQYAHKDEWVADSGYVHQPHKELNTFQLENVMKDWENKSGMNEDELNDLLDGFKWRGARKTLILSPRQLSVDFIQSFNKDMGEESEVEEIWEEKMAVQG